MEVSVNVATVLGPVQEVLRGVSPLILNLFIALILILGTFLIATGLHRLVFLFLSALNLDRGSKKSGFTGILSKGGIERGPAELAADLFYWLTLFTGVTAVANVLGLAPAKALLARLMAYLPSVFSAAYILGVGFFVAALVASIVHLIGGNAGLSGAAILAKIVKVAVILFAFLAALGQLGISGDWIIQSISLVVGAVGLAFAIAFGLGAKERAAAFLDEIFG